MIFFGAFLFYYFLYDKYCKEDGLITQNSVTFCFLILTQMLLLFFPACSVRMDDQQPVGDDDDCFVFVKWTGVPHTPITADVVEGLLASHGQMKYLKILSQKTYGYAEFKTKEDVKEVCKNVDNFFYKGVTFRVDTMPTEPVFVPTSRNPEDVKFRADLNKTIKARAHDRLVYIQGKEKHEKKLEKQRKIEQAERDLLIQRDTEKRMMFEATQNMLTPSIASVNFSLPIARSPPPTVPPPTVPTPAVSPPTVPPPTVPTPVVSGPSTTAPVTREDPLDDPPGSYRYDLANPGSVAIRIKSEIKRTLGPNLRIDFDTNLFVQLLGSLKITPLPGFHNPELLEGGFSVHPTLDFIPAKPPHV